MYAKSCHQSVHQAIWITLRSVFWWRASYRQENKCNHTSSLTNNLEEYTWFQVLDQDDTSHPELSLVQCLKWMTQYLVVLRESPPIFQISKKSLEDHAEFRERSKSKIILRKGNSCSFFLRPPALSKRKPSKCWKPNIMGKQI